MQPVIFFEGKYNLKDLGDFKKNHKIWKLIDIYEQQLCELFEIRNPSLIKFSDFGTKQKEFISEKNKNNQGNWVYFPWSGIFLHMVNKDEYFELRTNRNRNLITKDEQVKLNDSCIGIVGLSVGTNTALGLTYQGIANTVKLAEYDSLNTTNLNRVKAGLHDVGSKKIEIVSRQIYDINPYADLSLFENGLNENNLDQFINQSPKPQIIFELIDDFKMKINLRLAARKAGIPVIMLTNLGDSVLVDIERFDLNPSLELFNGLLGTVPQDILDDKELDVRKYAMQIVGIDNVPHRARESVKEIGDTLVGRPQLFSTLSISSGIATYIAKKLILGKNLPSGRRKVQFDEWLNLESL